MKKIICILLSVLLTCALFTGCANDGQTAATATTGTDVPLETLSSTTEAPTAAEDDFVAGIHYKGIAAMAVDTAALEAAEGRAFDAETTIDEKPMYIYNNVTYLDLSFSQLQCILYSDKATITLTYALSEGETVESALDAVNSAASAVFGQPSVAETTSGSQIYTWRDSTVNDNYLCLYANGETELKLSFYLF